jgi:hypothetical protein
MRCVTESLVLQSAGRLWGIFCSILLAVAVVLCNLGNSRLDWIHKGSCTEAPQLGSISCVSGIRLFFDNLIPPWPLPLEL